MNNTICTNKLHKFIFTTWYVEIRVSLGPSNRERYFKDYIQAKI